MSKLKSVVQRSVNQLEKWTPAHLNYPWHRADSPSQNAEELLTVLFLEKFVLSETTWPNILYKGKSIDCASSDFTISSLRIKQIASLVLVWCKCKNVFLFALETSSVISPLKTLTSKTKLWESIQDWIVTGILYSRHVSVSGFFFLIFIVQSHLLLR